MKIESHLILSPSIMHLVGVFRRNQSANWDWNTKEPNHLVFPRISFRARTYSAVLSIWSEYRYSFDLQMHQFENKNAHLTRAYYIGPSTASFAKIMTNNGFFCVWCFRATKALLQHLDEHNLSKPSYLVKMNALSTKSNNKVQHTPLYTFYQ